MCAMYSVGYIQFCLVLLLEQCLEVYAVVDMLDRFAARRLDVLLTVQIGCLLLLSVIAVCSVLLGWTLVTAATSLSWQDCGTVGVKRRSSISVLLCTAKRTTCLHRRLSHWYKNRWYCKGLNFLWFGLLNYFGTINLGIYFACSTK